MGVATESRIAADLYVFLFFVSSVTLVILIKVLYRETQFPFSIVISWTHIASTTLLMFFGQLFGYLEKRKISSSVFLGSGIGLGITGALCNTSLLYNSIALHQFYMLLHKPIYAILQSVSQSRPMSRRAKSALGIMCFGVIGSILLLQSTLIGALYGVLASAALGLYYNEQASLQKSLKLSPALILWYQLPIATLSIAPILPLFEDVTLFVNLEWSFELVSLLIFTSVLAAVASATSFLAVGVTSPTALKIVESGQFLLILILGYIIFGFPAEILTLAFNLVALGGAFLYSSVQLEEIEFWSTSPQSLPLSRKTSDSTFNNSNSSLSLSDKHI